MRQASWEEMFREGEEPKPNTVASRFAVLSWEEIVTLSIVLIAFVTVVESINSADWVEEMPSLFGVALLGLGVGLMLARSRLNEFVAHFTALTIGTVGVVLSATSKLEGSVVDRVEELADRMWLWGDALWTGGISNDNLPFVLLVVASSYLMAYLAAWSVFRWYNAWIALVPAGLALLTNISYLPGQNSFAIIIYLFCAILLVARVNLLRSAREWRRRRTGYPDFISLHVLNVTVWVAIVLLAFAWVLPVGSGNNALFNLWQKITAPIAAPFGDFGRVFSAIDSKKGGSIHTFGSTLPLQGSIALGGGDVMEVTTTEPGFLRAQTYDFYTAQGWKVGPSSQITTSAWPALKALQSPEEARRQLRRPVSVQVTTARQSNVIVGYGQPLAVNVDSRVVFGADTADVTSIRPTGRLNDGATYRVDSTVSNASIGRLQAATNAYPSWTDVYRQLPNDLPGRVIRKAQEVAAGAANAYDKATAIETYLRTLAVDTKIKPAPAKKDSVEYFLFDLQRGYFDYHASAMVVMLRTLGVPARMAVGYVVRPSDRVPDTNVYEIANSNSFAWPEVYFPGLGWVEFNPTPSEPRIARTGNDDQPLADTEEDIGDELPFALEEQPPPVDEAGSALDDLELDEGTSLVSQIIMTVILLFLGVTLAAGGVFQYSWQHGLGGLAYPVQVWEKTLRLANWARIRPLPHETPREVVARLKRELPEVDDIEYLGETYIRSRYGQKELQPAEKERLETVWKAARNNLMGRLFRWK